MPTVFRVTARAGGSIGDANTMDGVIELASDAPPGSYRIEKITLDPATGDLRVWEWGAVRKNRKGVIKLYLPPGID
jgi:hypothetical protein